MFWVSEYLGNLRYAQVNTLSSLIKGHNYYDAVSKYWIWNWGIYSVFYGKEPICKTPHLKRSKLHISKDQNSISKDQNSASQKIKTLHLKRSKLHISKDQNSASQKIKTLHLKRSKLHISKDQNSASQKIKTTPGLWVRSNVLRKYQFIKSVEQIRRVFGGNSGIILLVSPYQNRLTLHKNICYGYSLESPHLASVRRF